MNVRKSKSKIGIFMLLFIMLFIISVPLVVSARTIKYETTYNMKGGVYSQSKFTLDGNSTYKNKTVPTSFASDNEDLTMTVYVFKSVLGPDPDISSHKHPLHPDAGAKTSSTSISDEGTYYTYLRNWSGFRAKGDLTITIYD